MARGTTVSSLDLKATVAAAEHRKAVLDVLKRRGKMRHSEIAEYLGLNDELLRDMLYNVLVQLKAMNKIKQSKGYWHLIEKKT